ncbi:MAG: hypothetical protein Q9187_001554 [Circinaria calcarea]
MASPESQTLAFAVSSPCQCGRCGEVIRACRMENRPGSRDPQFHTVLGGWYLERTSIALYDIKDGEERESRRKSDKRLYKLWENIDLDIETSPVRIMPLWARNDHVLRKIRGLPPANETYEQRMERLREEFKDHPFCGNGPYPSIPSPSIFTDDEIEAPDGDVSNSPESLLADQKHGASKPDHEIVEGLASNSVAFMDSEKNFRGSSAHIEESMIPRESLHSIDNDLVTETSHEPYDADSYNLDSSSYSYSDFSSPLTPLPSSQTADVASIENPSLPSMCAHTETYSPETRWYDHSRFLRQDGRSQASKVIHYELDYSGKSVIPRPISDAREIHPAMESERESVGGEGRNGISKVSNSGIPFEEPNKRIHTTLKRKRDVQHAFPSEFDFAFINPIPDPRLRPRKRLCYKT